MTRKVFVNDGTISISNFDGTTEAKLTVNEMLALACELLEVVNIHTGSNFQIVSK